MTDRPSLDRHTPPQNTRTNLNDNLEKKLFAYAIGAGAVATGLIPLAEPAQAEVVFVPTHVHLNSNQSFAIDIQGTTEFTLTDKLYVLTGSFSTALLSVTAAASAAVVGRNQKAAAMKPGNVVGPAKPFQPNKALLAGAFKDSQGSQASVFGPFAQTTQRYLGLKFVLNGDVHYGWVRFAAVLADDNRPPSVRALMTGYAYETTPNKPIQVGQTSDDPFASQLFPKGDNATQLQPATLGVLALGSTGIETWRREGSAQDR